VANGTLQQIADYMKSDWFTWSGNPIPGTFNLATNGGVIQYNITGTAFDSDGLSASRQALVIAAFDLYERALGIDFQQTTATTGYDFRFQDNGSTANTIWSSTGGNINFASIGIPATWNGTTGGAIGENVFYTIVHEIGHGLGLGHPGPYNFGAAAPIFDNDSYSVSVMSYVSTGQLPIGPMAADLLALVDLYGPQGISLSGAYTGNTTWGFNTNAGGVYANLATLLTAGNSACIADGSGVDTFDFSGTSLAQTIDLTVVAANAVPSTASSVCGQPGNLTLAVGTVIENAKGGSGVDTIIGNASANTLTGNNGADVLEGEGGADILIGGLGADILRGGAGNDTFLFNTIAQAGTTKSIRADGAAIAFDGAGAAAGDVIDFLALGDLTFGGTGEDRISVVNSGTNSNVRVNTDADAAFEIVLAIHDGAVTASAYTAADFAFV
jgi:Ca2+-binding RTX toxin-like protein